MSSYLQSSEATLDLVAAIEDALDGKRERKWRAKETLSINKARREETKRKQKEKATEEKEMEEKVMEEMAEKEEVKKKTFQGQAASRPPLEVHFVLAGNTSALTVAPPHDLKIIASGVGLVVFVHTDVLAACSEHFVSMLFGSNGGEIGAVSVAKVKRDNLLIVLLLVRFCYTYKYDIRAISDARVLEKAPKAIDPLLIHARIIAASQRYGMSDLTELGFDALEGEPSRKLDNCCNAGTLKYRKLAKRLVKIMRYSTPGQAPLHPRLRDFLIENWKKDDCTLACCYTTEEHFYELLLAFPEVMDEIVCLGAVHEARYEMLREAKYGVIKHGLDDDVVAFFRPLRLHTPVD